MTAAEFEEKQYECAFNVELGASGPVFASGQVLEKLTGYDASAAPSADHVLWQILTIPRPPGIRLVPDHWSPAVRRMRPDAGKLPELEDAQLGGRVVASTGFVSPTRLGRHTVWTYIRPGTVGRGNPDGEEISFASFGALFAPAPQADRGELANRSGLREHLASLAAACREVARPRSRMVDAWIGDVGEAADVPSETLEAVRDYAVVQSLVMSLGASWWLVDGDSLTPAVP